MIDMYASEPQFLDHLAPVWRALPEAERGVFGVARGQIAHGLSRGVPAATDMPGDQPVLVASYGDVKRMRRLGRKRIAFLEHGIGQSYGGDPTSALGASYSGGRDRDDVGLFLVPNRNAAGRWRASYPATAVRIVGCPKIDAPVTVQPHPGPVVAISFHWECHFVAETRSARREFASGLPALAERFTLIGHGHPRAFAMDRLERLYRGFGIAIVPDFADVLARADVYVCDNSSTLYEFAATGRPVVVMNPTGYRREVHHGLRFWEAAAVGVQVDRPVGLVAAVELALSDPEPVRRDREQALDIVYAYRDGRASERAAIALREWASEAAAVAA